MASSSMLGQDKTLLSIILTTYNSSATIGRVLDALVKQDFPLEKVELIIVDGGSKDETMDIVRGFIENYRDRFADVMFVVHDRNYGVSRARNDGMRLSKGRYILILDHDVIMPPNTLKNLYEYLERAPSEVIAVTPLHRPIEGGRIMRWQYLLYRGRITTTNAITSCVLMRRKLVDDVGYYDETLGPPFTIYEDIEYGARAISRGYRIDLLGTIEVLHDAREGVDVYKERTSSSVLLRYMGLLRGLFSCRYRYALIKYLKSSPISERIRWTLYATTLIMAPTSMVLALISSLLWPLAPAILLTILYLDILKHYMNLRYIHISLAYSALALLWRIARSFSLLPRFC